MSISLLPVHLAPRIFGHVILDARLGRWRGFRYARKICGYRNWITTDFELRLGFIVIEGWIP